MKELSVVVLGSGRWARALTGLLTNNQHKQRGTLQRVWQYAPPRGGAAEVAPIQHKAAHQAGSDDATMMHMNADALAGLGDLAAKHAPRASLKAESDDATMMHMTADSFARLSEAPAAKPARGTVKAHSDDATMTHFTAEALAGAIGEAISIKPSRGMIKASSDDATMMHMTADSLLGAVNAGATAPNELKEIGSADLILLAVSAASARPLLRRLRSVLRPNQMLVHSIGSFFPGDTSADQPALLISDLVRQETPLTRIGALAGPALAQDLEEYSPAGLVCGSAAEVVISATRQALGCSTLRIYGSSDMIGVEVARAMSSVVALAAGVCDVLEFGTAARAMLVSRSASELVKLGTSLGGKERTFLGLAGFGSLMAASERKDSLDFQLGRLIGSGKPLAEAQKQLDRSCESVGTIRDAYGLVDGYGLRTPILTTLYGILFGGVELSKAIKDLLDDPNYSE